MPIAATTVWQMQTDGDDLNGGGYNSANVQAGKVDQSLLAATSFADLSCADTSTTLTSGAGDPHFTAAMCGSIIQISSGTQDVPGFYEIVTFVGDHEVTIDRTCAVSGQNMTSGVGRVGGALLRLDKILSTTPVAVGGNVVYVKSGTYTKTTEYTIGADGNATNGPILIVGYDTTRTPYNTDATRPLITTATNSITCIVVNGANDLLFRNLSLSNTAATRYYGISWQSTGGKGVGWENCKFDGFTNAYRTGENNSYNYLVNCEIANCSEIAAAGMQGLVCGCYFHDNAKSAISTWTDSIIKGNIFDTNGADDIDLATTASTNNMWIEGNTFYHPGGAAFDGINIAANSERTWYRIVNNIFYGCAYAINSAETAPDAERVMFIANNAFGSCTSGFINPTAATRPQGTVTLTADPFTDAANGDFSLNTTSGAGAACRAAGFPGVFPGGLSTGYTDIGAVQHADPAGGGGGVTFTRRNTLIGR